MGNWVDFLIGNEGKMLMLFSELNCFILFCKSIRDLFVLTSEPCSTMEGGNLPIQAKLKALIHWSNICYLEWNLKKHILILIFCVMIFSLSF